MNTIIINRDNVKSRLIGKKQVFIAIIVACLNIMFVNDFVNAIGLVIIELLVLLFQLFRKSVVDYIGYYLIFLCLSLEFDAFVGTNVFYGFKNFRILGLNLGIIGLLPILALSFINKIDIKHIKLNFFAFYRFSAMLIFLSYFGILMGLITIFFDDNNVQGLPNVFSEFINVSYSMIAFPLFLMIAFGYILTWESARLNELKKYIIAVFIGVAFSYIYSFVTNSIGYYAGIETLLVSSVNFLLPFLLVYPFYFVKDTNNFWILFLGIVSNILMLIYNANGKAIILCTLLPFLWLARNLKGINKFKKVLAVLAITTLLVIITINFINFAEKSILLSSKLNQAISLISFWE